MADSIREKIIQRVMTALAAITVANGYNTGCGAHVHRGKRGFSDASDLPAVVVFPQVETSSKTQYGTDAHVMPVEINAALIYGGTSPSVLGEQALADIIKAMGTDPTLNGLASSVTYAGGGIDEYPDEAMQAVVVVASFEVAYETRRGDPYNQ